MPRLNIYIPDDLDLAIRSHPDDINLSRVCAAAIRAELAARRDVRSAEWLFTSVFEEPGWLDRELMERFALRQCFSGASPNDADHPRDIVARWTSLFLNRTLFERLALGVGGGLQMWSVVRRLDQRNIGMPIWAIGFGHVDHELPHVHPNALVTMLSLLYAPRSKPMLVGAAGFEDRWSLPALFPRVENVRRLIIGSCSMFDADSSYARLLGAEMTDFLVEENVMGDFLGVFLTPDGRVVEPYAPTMPVSHVAAADLRVLSKREDTIVLLAAGGGHKVKLIQQVLSAGLCNTLITDASTAHALSGVSRRGVLLDDEEFGRPPDPPEVEP